MKNANSRTTFMARRASTKQNQRGLTTVQIAIGLLVAVIALLGSFGGFQYVATAKTNTDLNAMLDLKTATQRYGATLGSGGFTAANAATGVLVNLGFYGSSGFTATTGTSPSVTHQYGGSITSTVAATGEASPTTDGITFTWSALPSVACRELALRLDSIASGITATPNGGTKATVKSTTQALSAADAATGCAGAGSTNVLTVTLTRT